ncbi:MAG: hypothetical protein RMM31_03965 [Anaerolineae bacterium]|nr:hypothetical protein [Thermoflexales bacterium]MDW8395380.1 hypothetical protein [Anaerolineae bacterium]
MSSLEASVLETRRAQRDWIHPLLAYELRRRAQHPTFTLLLGMWLALIIGSALLIYLVGHVGAQFDPEALSGIAPSAALTMAVLCIALAIFVSPGLTSTAFCSERVRGMLRLLHLTPAGIAGAVWFKQLAAWSVTVVLLVMPLPVVGLSLVQGVPEQPVVLIATASIALSASWLFCALGLFCSGFVQRRALATASAYLAAVGISFALPAIVAVNLFALLADLPWVRGGILGAAADLIGWAGLSLSAPSAAVLTLADMLDDNPVSFSNTIVLRGAWSWVFLSAAYWVAGTALVGLTVRRLCRVVESG